MERVSFDHRRLFHPFHILDTNMSLPFAMGSDGLKELTGIYWAISRVTDSLIDVSMPRPQDRAIHETH